MRAKRKFQTCQLTWGNGLVQSTLNAKKASRQLMQLYWLISGVTRKKVLKTKRTAIIFFKFTSKKYF